MKELGYYTRPEICLERNTDTGLYELKNYRTVLMTFKQCDLYKGKRLAAKMGGWCDV